MNTDDLQKIAYEEIGGEEIFDPRKHAIPHGIRKEWYEEKFKGKATRIG